jgi:hypothetical protein
MFTPKSKFDWPITQLHALITPNCRGWVMSGWHEWLTRRSGRVYVGVMSSDVLYRLDLEVVEESCFISEPHYNTALGPVASARYPRIYLRRCGRKGKCR